MAPVNGKSAKSSKQKPQDQLDQEGEREIEPEPLSALVARNAKAIEKLQGLPEAFAEIKALILQCQAEEVNESDHDEDDRVNYNDGFRDPNVIHDLDQGPNDDNSFDVNAEANAMTGEQADESEDDISAILNQIETETEYGPELKPEVAESFAKLIKRKESKEETDEFKKRYRVPANCRTLCVQKVNPEIWTALPNKARQADFHLQNVQGHVSLTSIALARLCEKIVLEGKSLPGKWQSNMLQDILEIAKINNNTNQLLIAQRRKDMKRDMPSKETAALCSNLNEASELLFGDNLQDKIKLAKSAMNLVRPKMPAFRRSDSRNHPYRRGSGNSFRPFPVTNRGGPRFRRYHTTAFSNAAQNSRPFNSTPK